MKIRKDDNVIVITGKDKGKTGKVLRAFPKENKILLAGVNVKKVHKKATKSDQKGQIVDKALPIHVSNVMIVDPKTGKPSRVGINNVDRKNVRVSKKSGVSL